MILKEQDWSPYRDSNPCLSEARFRQYVRHIPKREVFENRVRLKYVARTGFDSAWTPLFTVRHAVTG